MTEVAVPQLDLKLDGAGVALQGFGTVGKHAARFFAEKSALVVAAADSTETVHRPAGFDASELVTFKESGGHFSVFGNGGMLSREAVIAINCDILVPAARPDVIRVDNQEQVQARLVVQGANFGVIDEAETKLVGPEKAGFHTQHGEGSSIIRHRACWIVTQKILRCLRISRRFCPAPLRITLIASPSAPLR